MVDMSKNAYVRMRGSEWDISPDDAANLERLGLIWRDYDCEQNTVDNGYPDEGPCYGVTGEEDSEEENATVLLLNNLENLNG